MKRFAVIFILLLAAVSASAQTDSSGFFVQSFKKLEWDLDARSNYPELDQNNRKAALIKVVIPEAGFDFDVGVMGVVGVRQEVGEIWVMFRKVCAKSLSGTRPTASSGTMSSAARSSPHPSMR